jgi:hypothetical protein
MKIANMEFHPTLTKNLFTIEMVKSIYQAPQKVLVLLGNMIMIPIKPLAVIY